MPNFDAVTRDHVVQAMEEYDALGADDFLSTYGFGPSRSYLLVYGGKEYDSKAILGVAYRHVAGRAAAHTEFSGGKDGAAKVLEDLGFDILHVGPPEAVEPEPVTGSWVDASEVGQEAARSAWADAARHLLLERAKRYHSTITYGELGKLVQAQTGIRTRMLLMNWIGDVLGRVSAECSRRGEPLLSALCVDSQGSVGEGYAIAVESLTGERPGDADDHAAAERLECHRLFQAADLPADGGTPALTQKLAASRARIRKAKAPEPVRICPSCFTALPATGVCDNCS